MSTARMLADSTQCDAALENVSSSKRRRKKSMKKGTKRHKKDNMNKSAKEEKRQKEEEEECISDLDLKKPLKSIESYISDRQEMLEQVFHCVQGSTLRRALPDILQNIPFDELKRLCLEQLEVMSRKRISRILQGADPAMISSSGTDDDEDSLNGECDGHAYNRHEMKSQAADSTSLNVADENRGMTEGKLMTDEEHVTGTKDQFQVVFDASDEVVATSKINSDQDMVSTSSEAIRSRTSPLMFEEEVNHSNLAPSLLDDSSLRGHMEILELEMRARAIKAMLRANEQKTDSLKETTSYISD